MLLFRVGFVLVSHPYIFVLLFVSNQRITNMSVVLLFDILVLYPQTSRFPVLLVPVGLFALCCLFGFSVLFQTRVFSLFSACRLLCAH